MKKIFNIIYRILFVFLLAIAGLAALSAFRFPDNFRLFVVQSGSMEPAIGKGSLVFVTPTIEYRKNDVITVKSASNANTKNPNQTITHRIVDVEESRGSIQYITKGDANNAPDLDKRDKNLVLGKVFYSIPFLGYPVGLAKTQTGFILLIVIPATLIVYSELMSIKKEAAGLIRARRIRKLTFPPP